MAINIAKLVAKITANTTGFERGMKRSRKSMRGFGKAAQSLKRIAVSALGAIGISLGVSKLISGLRSSAAEMDKLGKTSQRLGIATNRLAELQFAAKLTGVETNTLNLALQRMVRRVAEAAQGTGEAKAAIRELGLEAKKLAKLSPDKQFKEIARQMALVATQSDRVRLGFKLFDSEGVALINTLKLGAAGLDELAREARKLGIVVTPEQVARVFDMNDAWTKVSSSVTGLSNAITSDLSPTLKDLFDGMSKRISFARLLWGELISDVSKLSLIVKVAFGASDAELNRAALRTLRFIEEKKATNFALRGLGDTSSGSGGGGGGIGSVGGMFNAKRQPRFLERGSQAGFEALIRARQFGTGGRTGIQPLDIIRRLIERGVRRLELVDRGIKNVDRILSRDLPVPVAID